MKEKHQDTVATCRVAEAFAAGDALPIHGAELKDHARSCATCRPLLARYTAAVAAYRDESEAGVPRVPAFQRVRGAVDERGRQAGWWRGWFLPAGLVPVAAAAAVLVLLWPTARAPELEGTSQQTRPELASPPDGPTVASAGVTQVQGVVGYELDGDWRPLLAEAAVEEGAAIDTGVSGSTTVSEADVAEVDVAPRTRVRIRRWGRGSVALSLERGELTARVSPRDQGETFEIETPVARILVVGTVFVTSHHPEEGTVVRGSSGRVQVLRADGTEVGFVGPGESLRVPVAVAEPEVAELAPTPEPAQLTPVDDHPTETVDSTIVENPVAQSEPAGVPERERKARGKPRAIVARVDVGLDGGSEEPAEMAAEPPPPLLRARALLAEGDPQAAIAVLEEASEGAPQSGRLSLLAEAYRRAGETEQAITAYETAIDRAAAGDSAELVVELASLLETAGRGDEARRQLEAYLEAHPDGRAAATAHVRLARRAASDGRDGEALSHWRAVLDDHANTAHAPEALQRVGQALLARGDYAGAGRLFESFVEARSARMAETALVGLMTARYGAGELGEVLRLAGRYEERFPDGRRAAEVAALLERARARVTGP